MVTLVQRGGKGLYSDSDQDFFKEYDDFQKLQKTEDRDSV